jgi:hypothetical protein
MNEETKSEAGKANTKIVGGILLALALTGGAATMASAQNDAPTTAPAVQLADTESPESTETPVEAEDDGHEECDLSIEMLDLEELTDEKKAEIAAEIGAEMQSLRDAFDAAGIAYTVETDPELGVDFVEWDFTDDAANAVADEVFEAVWGAEFTNLNESERGMIIGDTETENDALKKAFDEAAWDVVDGVFEDLFADLDAKHGIAIFRGPIEAG